MKNSTWHPLRPTDPEGCRPKVLVISSLFPRARNPVNGVFNFQSTAALARYVDIEVVSPVSWVDLARDLLRSLRKTQRSPAPLLPEVDVHYPVFFSLPFIGRRWNGYFQWRALRRALPRRFDLALCYWVYPDGYATYLLHRETGAPYVLVALGSDLNVMAGKKGIAGRIRRALGSAAAVVAVSSALERKARELGVDPLKTRTITNGVDTDLFHRRDKGECRRKLGLAGSERIVLFVGTMESVKGVDVLLGALSRLEGDLRPLALLVGEGPKTRAYRRLARRLGVGRRVRFLGPLPHRAIPLYLGACDCLVLPSRNEGCPNIVLEAMACGVPVVASRVGGIPELVGKDESAILVEPGKPEELARAIAQVLDRGGAFPTPAAATRSWDNVAAETWEVIRCCLEERRGDEDR